MVYKVISVLIYLLVYQLYGGVGCALMVAGLVLLHVLYRLFTGEWMPPAGESDGH